MNVLEEMKIVEAGMFYLSWLLTSNWREIVIATLVGFILSVTKDVELLNQTVKCKQVVGVGTHCMKYSMPCIACNIKDICKV